MKYLKKYKVFESGFTETDVQDVFESYINWNLIDDVKEMSLEYIDEGMNLNMEINYRHSYKDRYYILHIYYNHSETDITWNSGGDKGSNKYDKSFNNLTEGPYELELIDKNKIMYDFYFSNDDYSIINTNKYNEFVDRIKEAYPNENINKEHSEL